MIELIFQTFKSIIKMSCDKSIDKDTKKKFLDSIQLHTIHLTNEKNTVLAPEQLEYLKRGKIVWVDFGFNVGHEFGGKHPALILRNINQGEDIYVVPLDSGKLPKNKYRENGTPKSGYLEIPLKDNHQLTVFDLDTMDRWCNVLRLRCVSWLRVDFTSQIGYMRSDYIKKIEDATQIHRYTPLKKNPKVLTNS